MLYRILSVLTLSALASPATAIQSNPYAQTIWNHGYKPEIQIDQQLQSPRNIPDLAYARVGEASWYGPGFYGNRTANGEVFTQTAHTAAHRSLPFGTRVRVTNLDNGRSTVVRINDRGPFYGGRVIDLGYAPAHSLGITRSGTANVRLDVVN